MRRGELQEELRPRRRAELGGPRRHLVAVDALPQARAAERQIDEHGDAALLREREDLLLGVEIVDGVVDADEVGRLVAHELLERRVLRLERRRRADVAHAPGLLVFLEDRELRRQVGDVVHLDQIDLVAADARERRLDLRCARAGSALAPRPATLSFVAQNNLSATPSSLTACAATSSDAP